MHNLSRELGNGDGDGEASLMLILQESPAVGPPVLLLQSCP